MCILGTSSEPAQLVPTPGGGASGCLPLSCPIRTGPRRRQCREGVMSRYVPGELDVDSFRSLLSFSKAVVHK